MSNIQVSNIILFLYFLKAKVVDKKEKAFYKKELYNLITCHHDIDRHTYTVKTYIHKTDIPSPTLHSLLGLSLSLWIVVGQPSAMSSISCTGFHFPLQSIHFEWDLPQKWTFKGQASILPCLLWHFVCKLDIKWVQAVAVLELGNQNWTWHLSLHFSFCCPSMFFHFLHEHTEFSAIVVRL